MTDSVLTPIDAETAADRAEWIVPEVVVMSAGSAENGAGPGGDNQITFS